MTVSERAREFVYPPLARAGVVGRFGTLDMLCFAAAALCAVMAVRSVPSWGPFAVLLVAAAVLAFLPIPRIAGRGLTAYVRPALGAMADKLTGRGVYRGAVFAPGEVGLRMDLPADLAGLRMISVPARDGATRIGVILDESDKRNKTARAASFTFSDSLITADEALRAIRLDGWETILESFCQRGSGVSRWQLMMRTAPDTVNRAARHAQANGVVRGGVVWDNTRELVTGPATWAERHEIYLVIEFNLAAMATEIEKIDPKWGDEAIGAAVSDVLFEIEAHLAEENIQSHGWVRPGQYASILHTQFDPESLPLYDMLAAPDKDLDPRLAGPCATERSWKSFRHDSAVSQTLWVHELPTRPVLTGWMRPVLTQTGVRRTVSLVAEPLDAAVAQKQVKAQSSRADAVVADGRRRGVFVSARARQESRAALEQDEALAAGDGYFRYHLLFAVTADDEATLARQVLSVRRRFTKAHCQTVVLYGEQDQAFFAAALPLARGLRPLRALQKI